ncbi:Zinc finger protein 821 [Frankliniella fusca]|uniref:Zinc finger protein 821 n=1 Tax=Frankliniella fusca TaxID=407009 RepID=A0AAE1HM03_9NEOP|nr:Zinc finger protein 821 [Frankliniella fusca]
MPCLDIGTASQTPLRPPLPLSPSLPPPPPPATPPRPPDELERGAAALPTDQDGDGNGLLRALVALRLLVGEARWTALLRRAILAGAMHGDRAGDKAPPTAAQDRAAGGSAEADPDAPEPSSRRTVPAEQGGTMHEHPVDDHDDDVRVLSPDAASPGEVVPTNCARRARRHKHEHPVDDHDVDPRPRVQRPSGCGAADDAYMQLLNLVNLNLFRALTMHAHVAGIQAGPPEPAGLASLLAACSPNPPSLVGRLGPAQPGCCSGGALRHPPHGYGPPCQPPPRTLGTRRRHAPGLVPSPPPHHSVNFQRALMAQAHAAGFQAGPTGPLGFAAFPAARPTPPPPPGPAVRLGLAPPSSGPRPRPAAAAAAGALRHPPYCSGAPCQPPPTSAPPLQPWQRGQWRAPPSLVTSPHPPLDMLNFQRALMVQGHGHVAAGFQAGPPGHAAFHAARPPPAGWARSRPRPRPQHGAPCKRAASAPPPPLSAPPQPRRSCSAPPALKKWRPHPNRSRLVSCRTPGRERTRAFRERETPEERQARLARARDAMRAARAALRPEEKEALLAKRRREKAEKRAALQTPEDRKARRLARQREAKRAFRASLSPEEKEAYLAARRRAKAKRMAAKRGLVSETSQGYSSCVEASSSSHRSPVPSTDRSRAFRERETPEAREARLARKREDAKAARASLSPEEREAVLAERRRAWAKKMAAKRGLVNETPEGSSCGEESNSSRKSPLSVNERCHAFLARETPEARLERERETKKTAYDTLSPDAKEDNLAKKRTARAEKKAAKRGLALPVERHLTRVTTPLSETDAAHPGVHRLVSCRPSRRERTRAFLERETPEERQARLARKREAAKAARAALSPEEKEACLAKRRRERAEKRAAKRELALPARRPTLVTKPLSKTNAAYFAQGRAPRPVRLDWREDVRLGKQLGQHSKSSGKLKKIRNTWTRKFKVAPQTLDYGWRESDRRLEDWTVWPQLREFKLVYFEDIDAWTPTTKRTTAVPT